MKKQIRKAKMRQHSQFEKPLAQKGVGKKPGDPDCFASGSARFCNFSSLLFL